jgi:hypothetical protein
VPTSEGTWPGPKASLSRLFSDKRIRDNKKMYGFFFAVLLAIHPVWGDDSICEDIHELACGENPAGAADPSGKVLSAKELALKVAGFNTKFSSRLKEICAQALSSDASLRQAVEKKLKCAAGTCKEAAAQALEAVVERDVFGGNGRFDFKNLSLTDIYELITHPGFAKLSRHVQEEYRELVAPKAQRDDIEKNIFPAVRRLAIERLKRFQMDDKIRDGIIARINEIEPKAGECGLLKLDRLYPDSLSFSGQRNTLRICSAAMVRVSSRITFATMIAHEIAHAFDPCHIVDNGANIMKYVINDPKRTRDQQFPLAKLVSCLRGKDSIGAKPVKSGEECNKDQINEAFADWLAAEIIPVYVAENYKNAGKEELRAAYVNALWRTCNDITGSPYPAGFLRGNALLAANPKVRKQLGCPLRNKFIYCEAPSLGVDAGNGPLSDPAKAAR